MTTRNESIGMAALDASRDASGAAKLRAIIWGTLVAGTLDICAAILTWLMRDVAPPRVLQGVAAGLLGRDSFSGGAPTAALGLFLHFAIMSVIVTLFVLAARRSARLIPSRLLPAIVIGLAYGITVYLVMTYVVVPLSAAVGRPPTLAQFVQGVIVHMLCVGVPIALITRRVLRQDA